MMDRQILSRESPEGSVSGALMPPSISM